MKHQRRQKMDFHRFSGKMDPGQGKGYEQFVNFWDKNFNSVQIETRGGSESHKSSGANEKKHNTLNEKLKKSLQIFRISTGWKPLKFGDGFDKIVGPVRKKRVIHSPVIHRNSLFSVLFFRPRRADRDQQINAIA